MHLSKIENKKLDSGIEIFKFYSPKLERIVILENRKDMSLPEQLKEKQAFNTQLHTITIFCPPNTSNNNTFNGLKIRMRQTSPLSSNSKYFGKTINLKQKKTKLFLKTEVS